MGCVWCEMYHATMALAAIRSGLNMDAEGATPYEVAAEVKNVYNGRHHAMATLCGQVNGLRDIIREADRLLQYEFGGFYESSPSTEPPLFHGRSHPDTGPWVIGDIYLIRTVTNYLIGRVVSVGAQEIELEDAAWVAYTGRSSEALQSGSLEEVEPCPDGQWIVGRGAIVDAGPWVHGLCREPQ